MNDASLLVQKIRQIDEVSDIVGSSSVGDHHCVVGSGNNILLRNGGTTLELREEKSSDPQHPKRVKKQLKPDLTLRTQPN